MMRIELTLAAQRDLRSIYQYSKNNFGRTQAIEYVRGLRNTIDLLKSNPNLGRRQPEIQFEIIRLVYKQSVIFYRLEQNRLIIRRILDARQDPIRHL